MDNIYYDGNLKASLTVGSVSDINPLNAYTKDQVDHLLGEKSDVNHTHEQYLTEHQSLDHLALKEHTHEQYLTEHQDISHLATKEEIPSIKGLATEEYVNNQINNIDIPEVDLSKCATKEELNEVKQSVSEGKKLIASAITDLGIPTLATDEFQIMANNIKQIETNEFFELRTNGNTNYSGLFYKYAGGSLDLSEWDTSKVTDMSYMFSGLDLLSLDLSSFDTSNVTDMSYMFNNCSSLREIKGLQNFNTSKVTNMSRIFSYAAMIESLDLSSFDTSSVTDMGFMFYLCSSLKSLDLSNWDMSNTTTYSLMLSAGNSKLTNINLSNSNDNTISKIASLLPTKTEVTPGEIIVPETTSPDIITTLSNKYWVAKKPGGEPFSDFFTEYSINTGSEEVLVASFEDTIQDGAYLPTLNHGYDFIRLELHDGTYTTDLNTLASEVGRIKIYYPEETTEISFAGTKVKDVTYINLENIESLAFTNCTYLESVDLTDSNTTGSCIQENTFEGVSEECKITISKDWEKTEEDSGFNGTFPWNQ